MSILYNSLLYKYNVTITPLDNGLYNVLAIIRNMPFMDRDWAYDQTTVSFVVDPTHIDGMFVHIGEYKVVAHAQLHPEFSISACLNYSNQSLKPVETVYLNGLVISAPTIPTHLHYAVYNKMSGRICGVMLNTRHIGEIIQACPQLLMDQSGSIMRVELVKINALMNSGFYTDMACEVMSELTDNSELRDLRDDCPSDEIENKQITVSCNVRGCIWCFGSPHHARCPHSTRTLTHYVSAAPCGGCSDCAACTEYVSFDATVDRVVAAAAPF